MIIWLANKSYKFYAEENNHNHACFESYLHEEDEVNIMFMMTAHEIRKSLTTH